MTTVGGGPDGGGGNDDGDVGDRAAVEVLRGLVLDLGGKRADLIEIAHGAIEPPDADGGGNAEQDEQERGDAHRPAVIPAFLPRSVFALPSRAQPRSIVEARTFGRMQERWPGGRRRTARKSGRSWR